MRLSVIILTIFALAVQNTDAFVNKGSAYINKRPALTTSGSSTTTGLYAKKAAKKASTVDTLRKPELIAQVAEKLDTSKVGAEAAVAAVLETIVDVSLLLYVVHSIYSSSSSSLCCALLLFFLFTPPNSKALFLLHS